MIEKYIKHKNGVIEQLNPTPIKYDFNYVNNSYNSYGELGLRMSYLRYGYIVGTIGNTPKSIMDVGYGNGDFLKVCSETIKECYGFDVTNYPIPKNCKIAENIFKEVDVITFFDSLEHFTEIDFVKNLNVNYVVISVPWCHYEIDGDFEKWKHRRPNEHIFHFNEKSLTNFMEECNFKLVSFSNIEDTIRKPIDANKNILTAIFKKI